MEKKTLSYLGISLSAMAAATVLMQLVVSRIVKLAAPQFADAWWFTYALASLFYFVGIPVFLLFLRLVPKRPSAASAPERFGAGKIAVLYFICIAGMYIFNLVGAALTLLIGLLKGSPVVNPLESLVANSNPLMTLLYACVLAPVMEELVFRKLLLDRLRPCGDRTAIWVSAVAFGLFHMNLSQIFYAVAVGAVFAYVTLRSGSIRTSILLHMLVNFTGSFAVPQLALSGNKMLLLLAGGVILAFVGLGVALFAVHIRSIRLDPPAEPYLPPLPARAVWLNPGLLCYGAVCLTMVVLNTI